MTTPQIDDALRDIGPLLQIAELTGFASEHVWTLVIDEATVLFLDQDPDTERLLLSAEVGTPRDEQRPSLYETFLTYNNMWRQTGGMRMALDGAGGAAVLGYQLDAGQLEPSRLAGVIRSFVDVLRAWREALAQASAASAAGPSDQPFNPLLMGVIRG